MLVFMSMNFYRVGRRKDTGNDIFWPEMGSVFGEPTPSPHPNNILESKCMTILGF